MSEDRERTFTEALREALIEEMESDPSVFLLGEDIGVYGGAFGVTRGLLDRFGPKRVRQTPIAENSFVGIATGAAMLGMRPVVEIMFADFLTCCMDALVNHASKIHYMYAGQLRVPLVIRAPMGRRYGYGATHSQSLQAWFLHVPGLITVAPATPADAKGLLKAAIRNPNPVVFLEHKLLYPSRGLVPEGDHIVPIGSARVAREGTDVTVITYSHPLTLALEAAKILEEERLSVEVIDLRSLAPLDLATCSSSVAKTGRLVLLEEAWRQGGVMASVACDILDHAFHYLRAPIERIGIKDVPIPAGRELEDAVMPRVSDIVDAVLRVAKNY